MIRNKIAVAGMLAMSLGLAACGGNSTASTTSAADTSAAVETSAVEATSIETETSAASTTSVAETASVASTADATTTSTADDAEAILYWEGTLADGTEVNYLEDVEGDQSIMAFASADLSEISIFQGSATSEELNGETVFTITDTTSGEAISFTIVDLTDDKLTINVAAYGTVDLKPVTQAEFEKQFEEALALFEEAAAGAEAEVEAVTDAEASSTSAE